MDYVLLTARAFYHFAEPQIAELVRHGCGVVSIPREKPFNLDEFLDFLHHLPITDQIGAVILGNEPFSEEVFQAIPHLKIVCRWGIGYDKVDLSAATRHGVMAANTPGVLGEAVAEMAFAMMLAMARNLVPADKLVRQGGWHEFPGVMVWGKTLGIIGFGNGGQALARRGRGFEMKMCAYDPYPNPTAARELGVELVSLDEVIARADFLSLHTELNEQTHHLINAQTLRRMRRGAYLVNTARGGLVDEDALVQALESGHLAGAALDVHNIEPPPLDSPLLKRNDVIVTSHIAFSTRESIEAVNNVVLENVLDGLNGRRPRFLLNADVWKGSA